MKKFVITCLIVVCLISLSNAQDYNTGIGLRGGYFNGLSIKHFSGDNRALEFILDSRWRGFAITGLYEIHKPAFKTERLNWYYGLGGHIGFWNGDYTHKKWGNYGETYTVVGIDGILGLEYNFREIPFNLSLDWKPAFNIAGYTGLWTDSGALSIRYIF